MLARIPQFLSSVDRKARVRTTANSLADRVCPTLNRINEEPRASDLPRYDDAKNLRFESWRMNWIPFLLALDGFGVPVLHCAAEATKPPEAFQLVLPAGDKRANRLIRATFTNYLTCFYDVKPTIAKRWSKLAPTSSLELLRQILC